jgi:hypothetical protein
MRRLQLRTLIRYSPASGIIQYLAKQYAYPVIVPDSHKFARWSVSPAINHLSVLSRLSKEALSSEGIVVIDCLQTLQSVIDSGFTGQIIYCEHDRLPFLVSPAGYDTAIHLKSFCPFTRVFNVSVLMGGGNLIDHETNGPKVIKTQDIQYAPSSGFIDYLKLGQFPFPILFEDEESRDFWDSNDSTGDFKSFSNITPELLSSPGLIVMDSYRLLSQLKSDSYQGKVVFCICSSSDNSVSVDYETIGERKLSNPNDGAFHVDNLLIRGCEEN